MSEPELPDIRIEVHSTWCERHLAPYRPLWPQGYLPATLCLVHQALCREDIQQAAAGRDERGLNAVLREHGPLCCLLGDELVSAITAMALDDDLEQVRALLVKYGPPPEDTP